MTQAALDFLTVWSLVFGGLFVLATLEQIGLLIGRAWRYFHG